jgi:hypothetical protein
VTDPTTCSPARPWGIHPAIVDNLCPRCGWTARTPMELGEPGGELAVGLVLRSAFPVVALN